MFSRTIAIMALTAITCSLCWGAGADPKGATENPPQTATSQNGGVKGAQAFRDVLEVPSKKSKLAASSLINGIARAGSRLVGVGERGHILYSDDQGKRWTQATVPVSTTLTAVNFPSPQKGWAVGNDGVVLHSSDGGVNWILQLDGRSSAQVMTQYYNEHPVAAVMGDVKRFADEGPDKPFLDVWFENETTGYIVGAFNIILQTADGGKSWSPLLHMTENPNKHHLFMIRPIAHDLYICGERGLLLKLDRKDGKFKTVKIPYDGTLFGVAGKQGILAAFGLRGNLFVSRDSGMTWKKIESGTEAGLADGAVTDDGRIVIASQLGQLIVSTDNGSSFKLQIPEVQKPASTILALTNSQLLIGGRLGFQAVALK